MLVVVATISLFVHTYSVSYMRYDPHIVRFFCYLSLFTFFMLMLVASCSLMALFIGWEGVGLCSYLLVNFWFTRLQANKAALKAVIVNRVGDISIILGAGLLFYLTSSLNFTVIANVAAFYTFSYLKSFLVVLSNLMMLIAAIGKSAQIGLHM
jgi:NADH:ubiquinone oxidoreductase subunit 5 (subunit L)/multisubunit Na+/H+ antiporter MnhA subunit